MPNKKSNRRIAQQLLALFVLPLCIAVLSAGTVFAVPVGEPDLSGGTDMVAEIDQSTQIDGMSITGTSESDVYLSLSVDQGILSFGTDTGLTYDGDTTGTELFVHGSIADLNTALGTLTYVGDSVGTTQFRASLTRPDERYNPANGHIYQLLRGTDEFDQITGTNARTEAANQELYGLPGYLATVTSNEERLFLGRVYNADMWVGGSDAETEGEWKWVGGDEAGLTFWSGGFLNGGPVEGRYSFWAPSEPNNSNSTVEGEDCLQYYGSGRWNDYGCEEVLNNFLVEYGTTGNLPDVAHREFTITTEFPEGDTVSVDDCADLVTIDENPADYRYDTINLTTNIDCSEDSLTPMFDGDGNDFRGSFDGNGFTISNLTLDTSMNYAGIFSEAMNASFADVNLSSTVVVDGQGCVGALVGSARNSDFSTINSSAPVTSDASGGGIVGCYQDYQGVSNFTSNTVTGLITGYSAVGGLIGETTTYNNGSIEVANNSFDGAIEATLYTGGIVGSSYLEDYGALTIEDNESTVSFDAEYSAGGIVGYLEMDDESVAQVMNNLNSGSIVGDYQTGGVIGDLNQDDVTTATVNGNTNSGNISALDGAAGGIVGSAYIDEFGGVASISGSLNTGDIEGGYNAGGIVGYADIDSDYILYTMDDNDSSADVSGYESVGGLVGTGENINITNSSSDGVITGTDSDETYNNSEEIGGLVGWGRGVSIVDSAAEGEVSGSYAVGGLVGYARVETEYETIDGQEYVALRRTEVINSSFSGTVGGNDEVGGLVGSSRGGLVYQSAFNGEVIGTTRFDSGHYDDDSGEWIPGDYDVPSVNVGGLVGYNDNSSYDIYDAELDTYDEFIVPAEVVESYAEGTLSGHRYVGGLVGRNYASLVTDSYTRMDITITEDNARYIGGAIGHTDQMNLEETGETVRDGMSIVSTNMYSTGSITGEGVDVGGLVGYVVRGDVTNSFWDTQTSGMSESALGTGKTTAEMKDIDTYTDNSVLGLETAWNFADTWGIYPAINNGYPCLNWADNDCNPNDPNVDNDGISGAIEDAAPNGGDANNDGQLDSRQGNVSSFVNSVSGAYTTLEVAEGCALSAVGANAEGSGASQDAGYNYPAGLVSFVASCGEAGFSTTVKVFSYGTANQSFTLRKFNSETNSYTTLGSDNGVTFTTATIGGQAAVVASYTITDGSSLDQDGEVNGVIVDPVGLGVSAVSSPNTGFPRR